MSLTLSKPCIPILPHIKNKFLESSSRNFLPIHKYLSDSSVHPYFMNVLKKSSIPAKSFEVSTGEVEWEQEAIFTLSISQTHRIQMLLHNTFLVMFICVKMCPANKRSNKNTHDANEAWLRLTYHILKQFMRAKEKKRISEWKEHFAFVSIKLMLQIQERKLSKFVMLMSLEICKITSWFFTTNLVLINFSKLYKYNYYCQPF